MTTTATTTLAHVLSHDHTRDQLLAAGMSSNEAIAKATRFTSAAQKLIDAGNKPDAAAVVVFVPGRIEVMGKHTDYCGGRSLVCTVERGMCFVAVARQDATIRFFATDLHDSATFSFRRDVEPTVGHWSNYPMTVARRVARNFPTASTGVDIAMSSDLPPASGLSSSSAMIVGTFMVLSRVNGLTDTPQYQKHIHSREELAGYLGCIENGQNFGTLVGDKGVGTFGGSQDHTAILCGKPGRLSVYSFCPVVHERDVELADDLRFIIVDSGVIAEKTRDALEKYNRVSLRARRLVSLWNESTGASAMCLREVVQSSADAVARLNQLTANEDAQLDLPSRLDQFIVEANDLIPRAVLAIGQRDWPSLGKIVDASQHRAETQLHNQVPETITLQRELRNAGAIAASAFGAGFGGSVWGLVRAPDVAAIVERLTATRRGVFVTRPGCAAIDLSVEN